jgi:hypothetical protein
MKIKVWHKLNQLKERKTDVFDHTEKWKILNRFACKLLGIKLVACWNKMNSCGS